MAFGLIRESSLVPLDSAKPPEAHVLVEEIQHANLCYLRHIS